VDSETFDVQVDKHNSVFGMAAKIEQRKYTEYDAALILKNLRSERGSSRKIYVYPSSIAPI
jgi:hypothetical protein